MTGHSGKSVVSDSMPSCGNRPEESSICRAHVPSPELFLPRLVRAWMYSRLCSRHGVLTPYSGVMRGQRESSAVSRSNGGRSGMWVPSTGVNSRIDDKSIVKSIFTENSCNVCGLNRAWDILSQLDLSELLIRL